MDGLLLSSCPDCGGLGRHEEFVEVAPGVWRRVTRLCSCYARRLREVGEQLAVGDVDLGEGD